MLLEAVLQERGLLLGEPQLLARAAVVVVLGAGRRRRGGNHLAEVGRLLQALPLHPDGERRHAVAAAAPAGRGHGGGVVGHAERQRRLHG